MSSKLNTFILKKPLVLDGAMGSRLQQEELSIEQDYLGFENCIDLLTRTKPDLIKSIHDSFLDVGADAIETNTFGANPLVLSEFNEEVASWSRELCKQSAELARDCCDAYSTPRHPRFVLGSLGPGTKLISLNQVSWDTMLASYVESARGLLEGGVDAFLIETCQDLLQIKCAINACLQAIDEKGKTHQDIPILVSVTIESSGTMLVGSDIAAVVNALRSYPLFSLGLNCATGPTEMAPHISHLSKNWPTHISCIPNAGLPILMEGHTQFPLGPIQLAESMRVYLEEYGLDVLGGCCGTTPEHIEQLVTVTRNTTRGRRDFSGWQPGCSSLYTSSDYRQEQSLFIVGERMNASGSRKFKRLLSEEKYDEIVSLAKQQVREGANCLDINVDSTERDCSHDMATLVQNVIRQVDAPLMLDSTQLSTIEVGLKHAGGKCVINSTNFEEGVDRFDKFCKLAKTYGSAIVFGTIDENEEEAMARTAERKFTIAQRAIQRARNVHNIPLSDIFIDPLVLPISTGMEDDRRSSLELIEGVRRIAKQWPNVQITCGLSNCSFGLHPSARQVLNSVLLWELMDAGLTSSIMHSSKIQPMNRIHPERKQAALDLIYDRRALSQGGTGLPVHIEDERFDPLQEFVSLFDDEEQVESQQTEHLLSVEERLQTHIVNGDKDNLLDHLSEALEKYTPIEIINDHLLAGMKTVGELFGSGQMQLPFVLQSAEVMKQSVKYLEQFMEQDDTHQQGRIVLATVRGDVHDIGKNLVDIILSNNGWSVSNIGIKQSIEEIVQAWRESGADAIGMSGLLVKSVMVMEDNLKALNEMNIGVPVLLGGAPLSRNYCESHLRTVYEGELYYGKDAFEGLRICNAIAEEKQAALTTEIELRLAKRSAIDTRRREISSDEESNQQTVVSSAQRSEVSVQVPVPTPPFWGDRVVDSISLDEIYPYINTKALFRGQWGFRKGQKSKGNFSHYIDEEVRPIFDRLKSELRDTHTLQPKVVYGYFPVASDGDDLVIFDYNDPTRALERLHFPRQTRRRKLCIADFFRSIDCDSRDVLGMSCVTMGSEVSKLAATLFANDSYQEYLYVHGMGVECAEALAELWHKRMREELGINDGDSPYIQELFSQKYRGSRYSFGYPACPDLSQQEALFRLLRPDRIGCSLTENWQIDPEQSTSAIIVHHPEANYFSAI
ncbi:MAG: methionine synthase [Phycisphaerales bacterium]|nr:methionine synthase [Phycisphaerales bacterium]